MPDLSALGGLVSAYIEVLPPADLPGRVQFLLNPHDVTVHRSAQWDSTPQPAANGGGTLQFHGTSAATTSFEILLDTFMAKFSGNMQAPEEAVLILKMAMTPTAESEAMGDPKPPMVTFGWGASVIFPQAVITECDDTYARQFPGGIRTRSTIRIGLMEVPTIVPGTNPTSGGLATRRTHSVIEGDTLASISYKHYGDPNKWRALAEANGIDDPLRLSPGTALLVPEMREIDQLV